MSPATRVGVFRPLTHEVPAEHWWIMLWGTYTASSRLTSRTVAFAQCGAPCWPQSSASWLAGGILRWCPTCFPGRQDDVDESMSRRQRRRTLPTPAPGVSGDDATGPGLVCGAARPSVVAVASQAGATLGATGGTGRWVGWLAPGRPPTDPLTVTARAAAR